MADRGQTFIWKIYGIIWYKWGLMIRSFQGAGVEGTQIDFSLI